jgi:hypothetical protein
MLIKYPLTSEGGVSSGQNKSNEFLQLDVLSLYD